MAKRTSSKKSKSKSRAAKRKASSKSKKSSTRRRRTSVKKRILDLREKLRSLGPRFRKALPAWLDEIVAFLLIVFGLVSLVILLGLSSTDAWLAISWGDTLRQLFGMPGALIVALGIAAIGLFVLLPKVGVKLAIVWHRVLAAEIAFFAFLAVFHRLTGSGHDPRLRAELGQGGGYIGWVLSEALVAVVGPLVTLIFWSVILAVAFGVMLGVRRRSVRRALDWLNRRARKVAYEIDPEAPPLLLAPPEDKPASDKKITRAKPRSEPHVRLSSPGPPGERESIVPRDEDNPAGPTIKQQDDFVIFDHNDKRKVRQREGRLPPLDLLTDGEIDGPTNKEISSNVKIIEKTLRDFGVDAQVISVRTGPTVTQYALQPFREVQDDEGNWQMERVRVSKIESLAGDLALALEAERLRIEAPVPGTSYVGVEVPNRNPSLVALRPLLESERFYRVNRPLAVPLGRDVSGSPIVVDLARMPHLLIAGTTGSGKSVSITSMITALLMNNTPDDLQLILLDPKMVELMRFNGVPHLVGPVETDIDRIIGVLHWSTQEMDRRYEKLEEASARNIESYNRKLGAEFAHIRMPYIVVFIDEIGDMMLSMPDETESAICRLAQMARAVGIHLVMATQRPSTDIITGLIKANFPARMSFAVASSVDSRVILDTPGAEHLLGNGDMLFLASDAATPQRVQSAFLTDDDLEAVVSYWETHYEDAIEAGEAEPPPRLPPWERGLTRREVLAQTDELLEDAIDLVVNQGRASTSLIQRRLSVGYPRAARIMGYLEELGIVSGPERGGRRRRVLIKPGEDKFRQLIEERARQR